MGLYTLSVVVDVDDPIARRTYGAILAAVNEVTGHAPVTSSAHPGRRLPLIRWEPALSHQEYVDLARQLLDLAHAEYAIGDLVS